MYIRFLRWLHEYSEHLGKPRPFGHRFIAGLYELLWGRFCGWGWRDSYDCARIYWFNWDPRTKYPPALPPESR